MARPPKFSLRELFLKNRETRSSPPLNLEELISVFRLRKILLNQKNQSLVQESEMLLYLADRIQHLKEVILPALEKGNLVLCDRFHDSTLAYQGFGRGLDLKLIRSIEEKAITPHAPFLTFLLDIEPNTCD